MKNVEANEQDEKLDYKKKRIAVNAAKLICVVSVFHKQGQFDMLWHSPRALNFWPRFCQHLCVIA